MARFENKNINCAPGPLFVDNTCIDCGTCYHIAPEIFKADESSQSYVVRQPLNSLEWQKAKEATVSCPVNSIGARESEEFVKAEINLPGHIVDGIYYCGYTSQKSYGDTSYLIIYLQGNIFVYSSRFNF